jgi:hypothetical protein
MVADENNWLDYSAEIFSAGGRVAPGMLSNIT